MIGAEFQRRQSSKTDSGVYKDVVSNFCYGNQYFAVSEPAQTDQILENHCSQYCEGKNFCQKVK